MGPVKFDDLPKAANEVLNDDYQLSGYQMKSKQKTSFGGTVVTTAVDLGGKDAIQTPAKITWKLPNPMGVAGISVDKLEMDKAGKFKLEASADKALHSVNGLKLEAKSDLADKTKACAGFTYTGLKDTQFKFETTPLTPKNFTFEVTRSLDKATVGLKCGAANLKAPDVGARLESGPLFCALLAKEKFSVFTAHAFYKASSQLKMACSYEYGGKKSGNFGVGLAYTASPGTLLKVKFQQDKSISCGVKHDFSKGFTLLAGAKYGIADKKQSVGLQLSLE
mmetsp:Transcript_95516/g.221564  ORF Transcript_95516/g.221564 Transcript_95516/m.221564 type:complete len:279 (-) Transcript_95516:164-1000(-)